MPVSLSKVQKAIKKYSKSVELCDIYDFKVNVADRHEEYSDILSKELSKLRKREKSMLKAMRDYLVMCNYE